MYCKVKILLDSNHYTAWISNIAIKQTKYKSKACQLQILFHDNWAFKLTTGHIRCNWKLAITRSCQNWKFQNTSSCKLTLKLLYKVSNKIILISTKKHLKEIWQMTKICRMYFFLLKSISVPNENIFMPSYLPAEKLSLTFHPTKIILP